MRVFSVTFSVTFGNFSVRGYFIVGTMIFLNRKGVFLLLSDINICSHRSFMTFFTFLNPEIAFVNEKRALRIGRRKHPIGLSEEIYLSPITIVD